NMRNCLFGVYDTSNDRSNYLRNAIDQQYNHNVRVGAMLNIALIGQAGRNRVELRNIFNQLGKSRYTSRDGVNAQADNEQTAELLYQSRMTYNGQLTGKHSLDRGTIDWGLGWAVANRNMPDRKRYLLNDKMQAGVIALSSSNDISREFTKLNENVLSASVNLKRDIEIGHCTPTLRAGLFAERRSRDYFTRYFLYNWNYAENNLPEGFRYFDLPTQLLKDQNYGPDKLYLLEEVKWRNNYQGQNTLGAAYAAINIPIGPVNAYVGLRFEANKMTLTSHTRDYQQSPKDKDYKDNDIFPSVNISYNINDNNILRLAYGKSVNRAEFREVSPSVYYDFDLASDVMG
ncbi:outer membrane beta-barrel family protein, partial [Salmonella enterica]|nr:outer membrane beta-barrel family protein [Salmonella enterica]